MTAPADEQAARERLELADQALPVGPWEVWTSCSFRRLTGPDGRDGGVLCGEVQRSDGHPDLSMSAKALEHLCALRNDLRTILSAITAAEERAATAERERDELEKAWLEAEGTLSAVRAHRDRLQTPAHVDAARLQRLARGLDDAGSAEDAQAVRDVLAALVQARALAAERLEALRPYREREAQMRKMFDPRICVSVQAVDPLQSLTSGADHGG